MRHVPPDRSSISACVYQRPALLPWGGLFGIAGPLSPPGAL
jgi:hypothetical protein